MKTLLISFIAIHMIYSPIALANGQSDKPLSLGRLVIVNRARSFPLSDTGRKLYNSSYITKYNDCYHINEELGNLIVPAFVQKVVNVVTVADPNVRAGKCPFLVGNVYGHEGTKDVDIYVKFQGDVTVISQPAVIANVTINHVKPQRRHAGIRIRTVVEGNRIKVQGNRLKGRLGEYDMSRVSYPYSSLRKRTRHSIFLLRDND
jgi:hypothetical protein